MLVAVTISKAFSVRFGRHNYGSLIALAKFELTLICVEAVHARCSSHFFAQQVSFIQSPLSYWIYPLNSQVSVGRGCNIHSVFFLYKQAGCRRAT